jgi:chorismate mutase/prephenate dehydratase
MLDLNEIRQRIDEIDSNIVELFEDRLTVCKEVAQFKIDNNKNVLDKERELQKIQKVKSQAKNPFNEQAIEELFTQIMAISRKLQYQILSDNNKGQKIPFEKVEKQTLFSKELRVVYQGVPGAYSQQAMFNYFGKDIANFNVATFRDAMEAIRDGKADYAVLPIENTTAGIVNDVYDLLMEFDNYIIDQTDVTVRHALLGLPDAEISDIRIVYSHPQGLMQCSEYLEEHKEWQQIAQANTAGSAKKVIEENLKHQAAIASVNAAKEYGLKVLEEDINRNTNNTTRFIIIGRQPVYTEESGKICVCFELPHASGTLYNMLSHFIFNGKNMTKIESRPLPNRSWEYRFYVEFEGRLDEPGTQNAIRGIMEETKVVKILGNY